MLVQADRSDGSSVIAKMTEKPVAKLWCNLCANRKKGPASKAKNVALVPLVGDKNRAFEVQSKKSRQPAIVLCGRNRGYPGGRGWRDWANVSRGG
jgi:hypothetical protein